MTVRIIDLSTPLPPAYENNQHALRLENGDVVLVMSGAEVAAYGWWAKGIFAGSGSSVTVDGRVYSEFSSGIWMQGGNINIGASGVVEGRDGAIWFNGYNGTTNVLTNAGLLKGPADGFAAVVVEGGVNIINNSGTIGGGFGGIQTNTFADPEELIVINNTGTIRGSEWSISGSYNGRHVITNKGLMDGMIILGYGNDVYDGRGGMATDEIWLDAGDDVAFGGDGAETFSPGEGTNFIDGGGGIDTVNFYKAATVDLRVKDKQHTGIESLDTILNIENLNGSEFADRFIGDTYGNVLVGNAGNDTLDGYDGNDLLSGGEGSDLLVGGAGTDTAVFSGRFSDYTITTGADGTITITDKRAPGDGTDYLGGVEFALFNDRLFTLPVGLAPTTPPAIPATPAPATPEPSTPAPTPTSPTQPAEPTIAPVHVVAGMQLTGSRKANVLVGGAGNDHLNGGLGKDKLTGNDGQDVFAFTTRLKKNVDVIIDFQAQDDTIQLSKSVFKKIKAGELKKSAFHIGAKAKDKSDRIIYNEKTGVLSYDADGSGGRKAVKFAKLDPKSALHADDFWII